MRTFNKQLLSCKGPITHHNPEVSKHSASGLLKWEHNDSVPFQSYTDLKFTPPPLLLPPPSTRKESAPHPALYTAVSNHNPKAGKKHQGHLVYHSPSKEDGQLNLCSSQLNYFPLYHDMQLCSTWLSLWNCKRFRGFCHRTFDYTVSPTEDVFPSCPYKPHSSSQTASKPSKKPSPNPIDRAIPSSFSETRFTSLNSSNVWLFKCCLTFY